MADRLYKLIYVVDPDAALRGLDAIEAKLARVDKAADALMARLRDLPKALQAQHMTVASNQMASALGQLTAQAVNTRNAVSSVGANSSNMNNAANRAATLASNLAQVAANGTAAGASVAGVGAGGMRGVGGGGAGAGGGMNAATIFGVGLARQTAFSAGHKAIAAVGQGAEARKQYIDNATQRFNDFRKELQEVANLTGQPTVNNRVIDDQLSFQRQTGMDADAAINFREQFLGAVESGQARGNITKDVASGLGVQAAQFAQRYNVDPASAGKLAGLLGEYGQIPTAEAGAQKMAEVAYHLNKLGVGQVRSMIPSLIGLQGEMVDENGGRFSSLEGLSARFAASTIRSGTPARAATEIRQANTALRRFGDEEVEGSSGHTLASVGITTADDFETALKKIAPKITGPDGEVWLRQHGFANQAERRSLIKQAKLIDVVESQKGIGNTAQARESAENLRKVREGAAAANAGYLGTDIGRQKLAENQAFTAEIQAGRQNSRFGEAKLRAETRLKQRGEIDSASSAIPELWQTFRNANIRTGREDFIETEVYKDLMRRTGITEDQLKAKFPDYKMMYGGGGDAAAASTYGPEQRGQLYERISSELDPRYGGSPAAAKHLQQAQQALGAAAQALQQKPPAKAPGPPPGFVAGRP